MRRELMHRLIVAGMLLVLAIVSCMPLAQKASRPETFAAVAASIDEKTETVLKLTATSTIASAAISAIPDDTATPIAEKLADFTEYFLLILCTLYAEKYLLTIIGLGTFRILIPAGCLLFIYGMLREHGAVKRLAVRFAAFGLVLFLAIPVSIRVSDMVFDTYRGSIDDTIASAELFSTEGNTQQAESGGLLSSVWSKVTDLTSTASLLTDRAAGIMNGYIESLAVMIVTSCIIPLLVLLFFLWLIRLLTGADLHQPARRRSQRSRSEETEGVTL